MAEIQLKHVYKVFDDGTEAVKDFNLDVKDKEFIIFVGPSGCGKSTTLRMIAGLEKISKGELLIDGKEMSHVPSCERDIAMVFQNYALYPHMTVAENMAYSLRIRGIRKRERRKMVEETADILGLTEVLDRMPSQLSGGQKQRVAMGRAIVRNPKTFLMDEPLSNLDAKLRGQMRIEILKLYRKLNTTFIYVTHDQTEAMTLGTRIVVMKDGEIQQAATPKKLYEKPANMFVAGFIGIPQMNFFRGKCVLDAEHQVVTEIDGYHLLLPAKLGREAARQGYVGKEVIVGVRPEDMRIAEKGNGISCTINVYELLGAEAYVYFDYKGKSKAIRVPSDAGIRKGDEVFFSFQEDKIHLFDAGTERRIDVQE